eukprot:CAMPEP_0181229458 /NCGR_PEP_ID=MMETSP1096-20121128/33906_1 /TAXON_ID=156174 ORGANISM="Chrysochromulina ericina, Strain CCMP281" /NCGR_SAMPLE_ID=MMETSP1096 /ASSEMBLY_ACC=CAM_ASM_000453 /LENGTH=166 /DNA_ID=CAMNT_0023323079 /DNA_START=119 /DNA_END=619 /DNA_ORIENTATION=-
MRTCEVTWSMHGSCGVSFPLPRRRLLPALCVSPRPIRMCVSMRMCVQRTSRGGSEEVHGMWEKNEKAGGALKGPMSGHALLLATQLRPNGRLCLAGPPWLPAYASLERFVALRAPSAARPARHSHQTGAPRAAGEQALATSSAPPAASGGLRCQAANGDQFPAACA